MEGVYVHFEHHAHFDALLGAGRCGILATVCESGCARGKYATALQGARPVKQLRSQRAQHGPADALQPSALQLIGCEQDFQGDGDPTSSNRFYMNFITLRVCVFVIPELLRGCAAYTIKNPR